MTVLVDEQLPGESGSDVPAELPVAGGAPAEMSAVRRAAIRNVLANWAGFGTESVVAFFLMPFLIHRLGQESYGAWILIGSLAGYLGILDFGLKSAIGRYVAYYRGCGDHEGVLRTLNTALALLVCLGTLAFGFVWLASLGLHRLIDIPAESLPAAKLALVIVGAALGSSFILQAFDAVLWGYERFDITNIVDALAALTRGGVTAYVVGAGYGLVGLAWTTLGLALLVGISKVAVCVALARPLRFSWRHVQLNVVREIGPFGFWQFLVGIARVARSHLNPIAVGSLLGPVVLTAFSVPVRLINYAGMLLVVTVNVLTPTLTTFVAQGDTERQRRLILQAGRICSAYSFYMVALLLLLGRPLIALWIGPEFAWVWSVLAILVVGEWLPMAVHPFNFALVALARQRPVAWRGIAECLLALGLGAALAVPLGLTGFAIAIAVAGAWLRGVFMLGYGGRVCGIPWHTYLRDVIIPTSIHGGLAVAGLAAVVAWRAPATWLQLGLYGGGFTVLYASCVARSLGDMHALAKASAARVMASFVRAA
jgi:O-antigen/teichoic acid export membrane protein